MKNISMYLNIKTIHDNLITGISVVDKNNIILSINDPYNSNEKRELVFYNVKQCRFDNFRLGNIILDITVLNINNINNDLCYIFDISQNVLEQEWIAQIKKDITLEKLIMIRLTTSYGMFGNILCERISFDN